MKWLKRIFLTVILLLILLCSGAFLYLYWLKPSYSGEVSLSGLHEPAEAYFDDYGIPHIYGKSEADVFRTLGYIQASERLFQIELIRRVSSGRLSEVFGNSMLDVDRFFRMLGIAGKADQSATEFNKHAGEAWQVAALAYLDGLNEYIEKGKTPLEFKLLGIPKEKYTVKDLYLVVSYVSFNFQMAFRTDPLIDRIQSKWGTGYLTDLGFRSASLSNHSDTFKLSSRLVADNILKEGFDKIQDKLPFQVWSGSNAMVIAANKSSSGKVLFENDTHIGHQQPSVWYESYLDCPGFRFYGSSIAGFPFAALGHTERHAWGLTIFENDDLDFYEEKINPDNPDQVWERDHWADLSVRIEKIHVKDSADVTMRCRTSVHGPVCSDVMKDFEDFGKNPVTVCWTFLREPDKLVQITYGLAHAKSMDEFKKALSELSAPGLNVLYGDRENNIAWWAAGKIARRPLNTEPAFVLEGASGNQDWTGYYPFELNPSAENPEEGFIFSCNQTPAAVNGFAYPGYYLPNDRADRLRDLLTARSTFSIGDLQNFNMDVVNPVAAHACKLLLLHLNMLGEQEGKAKKEIVEILNKWEGSHQLEDIAPAFYYRWYYQVYQKTFSDELGAHDADAFLKTHLQKSSVIPWLMNDSSKWWDDVQTRDHVETMGEIVTQAFISTFREFSERFGTNPASWTWNKFHTLELEHPVGKQWPLNYLFNVGPYPITGGMETINNQSFLFTPELAFKSTLGPAVRRTIDFADPENGWNVIPGGQSGNPMSPYYSDQTDLYVKGNLRKELMNRADIQRLCKNKIVFSPSLK